MTAYVHGVGSSVFGKQTDRPVRELVWEATLEALQDADVDEVDAVYVGSVFGPRGVAQRCLHPLGITGVPIVTIENACASGTTAFHEARHAVESGRYQRVLVLGVEHMTSRFDRAIVPEITDREGRSGMLMPGVYAMSAQRYMANHGVTPEQLAAVAVKNNRHALGSTRAQHKGELTLDDVLGSTLIADPLTRLQCCSISDGAAAAVLGGDSRGPRDIAIRGSALRSGELWDHCSPHVWGFRIVQDTASDAFEQAGLTVEDIDVFEVHDAFTIGEIVTVEALGLADEGTGGGLAERGETAVGGASPVNPSGGLLARGHPLGATGLAQIFEVVTQLRGEAGPRQVDGARRGLVETMGGGVSGLDGNGCVVAIFERP